MFKCCSTPKIKPEPDLETFPSRTQSSTLRMSRKVTYEDVNLAKKDEFVRKPPKKSSQESQFIKTVLKGHFIFGNLSDFDKLISKAFPSTFEPNQSIFKDGDPNYTYFIVERGIVEVLKNEKVVAQIKAGEGFGDESLIYGLKSGISARSCGEEVALWAIDYLGFYEGIKDVTSKFYQENIAFLDTVFILKILSYSQREAFASGMMCHKFTSGQYIIKEGEPAYAFYILKQGTVQVVQNGVDVGKLEGGDYFGETEIFYNTKRQLSIKATEDVST